MSNSLVVTPGPMEEEGPSGHSPWRNKYRSGNPKPLCRGLLHAAVGLCFPVVFAVLYDRIGPRLRLMLWAIWATYTCSALLHCIPWPSLWAEQAAMALDFWGIYLGMTGHILAWEAPPAVVIITLLNLLVISAALVYELSLGADCNMLTFMRRWRLSQPLQLLLLFIAQYYGMPSWGPQVWTAVGMVVAITYFRRYGAFDAESTGPLPCRHGFWSPHEWLHLMLFIFVHSVQVREMYIVEGFER